MLWHAKAVCHDLTIEILDPLDVIWMQGEVFNVAVHGVHESLSYAGVIQAKGVSKLMGCHQEQTVTWNTYSMECYSMKGEYTSVVFYLIFLLFTIVLTEAPFLVIVIAVCGTAPQLAISSPLTSAGVILFTQELKGEVAGLSLRISTGYSIACPNKVITTTVKKQAIVAALHCIYVLWFLLLTMTGTEAKFLVCVKVVCGGTPAVTIAAALCGAAVIFLPQKYEGEDALISASVSSKCVQYCQDEIYGQG